MYVLTVARLRRRCSAISAFDKPRPTRVSTSRSRSVTPVSESAGSLADSASPAKWVISRRVTSTAAYAVRRAAAVDTGTVLIPNGTPGLTDAAAPGAPLPTQVYAAGASVAAVGLPTQSPGTALVSPDAADRFGDSVTLTYADGCGKRS
jgi:putative ABC transport system permease protein